VLQNIDGIDLKLK